MATELKVRVGTSARALQTPEEPREAAQMSLPPHLLQSLLHVSVARGSGPMEELCLELPAVVAEHALQPPADTCISRSYTGHIGPGCASNLSWSARLEAARDPSLEAIAHEAL